MNENKIPFPQADDFEKIIKILNVKDEEKLKNRKYLSTYLGNIHERQVAYYLSAAAYVGIINERKEFTEFAKLLRNMSKTTQAAEMASKIISHPVFGRTFFMGKVLKENLGSEQIIRIMKEEKIKFESDELYIRRAQTVIGWNKWVNKLIG